MNIIMIGASTGGPRALRSLFAFLPRLEAAIVVVQHMPRFLNESLRRSLAERTEMDVRTARAGDQLESGAIYIAPSEFHLVLTNNRDIHLVRGVKVNYVCPSVDVAMLSLRPDEKDSFTGVILTGMASDGIEGIRHIKNLGGTVFVQDRKTAAVYDMPQRTLAAGIVDFEGSPKSIHDRFMDMFGNREAVSHSTMENPLET